MVHEVARVARIEDIARGIYLLRLHVPAIVGQGVAPGQFVHIQLPGATQHLLRRPISVMTVAPETGEMDLAIQEVGAGTRLLHGLKAGDTLNVLGPLGRGFIVGGQRRVFFVGGGVGVAPIRCAVNAFAPGRDAHAFLGFRSAAHAYALEGMPCPAHITTDDGSLGEHALVTDVLQNAIEEAKPELILACGPTPMLRTVQHIALRQGLPCQLSLEEHMACGVGACLVCTCKVRVLHGTEHRRVCVDGPVFDAKEVCFDG